MRQLPPGKPRGPRPPAAFTLIELLVSLSVIGVLASLLLPALGMSRQSARRSVCLGNLRQHAMGLSMYLADHNDWYPGYETWYGLGGRESAATDNRDGTVPIARPLNAYVGNPEAFRCASDKGANGVGTSGGVVRSCYESWGNSYLAAFGYDVWGIRHVTGASDRVPTDGGSATAMQPPIRFPEVAAAPATKVIEGDWDWRDALGLPSARGWHGAPGRFPMLFGDGHAEFFGFPGRDRRSFSTVPDPGSAWW